MSVPELLAQPPRPLLTTSPQLAIRTHDAIQRLVERARRIGAKEGRAIYDLTRCTDIDPGAVLLMMYAGRKLREFGWQAVARASGDSPAMRKMSKNLAHMKLSFSDRTGFAKDQGEYPLRMVEDKGTMVRELDDWASTVQKATSASPAVVAAWSGQISEVVTNGFQHGPTGLGGPLPPILLAGGAGTGTVQLAALDSGAGIPRVIEKFVADTIKQKGDGALIREACKKGVTSRCVRQNQGYGLPHLIESVGANGGTMQIFSQRGFVYLDGNGKIHARNFKKTERRLDGTFTVVSLRVG